MFRMSPVSMVSSLLLTCMLLTQARQVPGKPSCKGADFCEDPEDYPIHEDLTSEVLQKRRVRRTIQRQVTGIRVNYCLIPMLLG